MKKYIILLSIIAFGFTAQAQNLWNITYNIALPFGDTKSFADNTSFRGVGIDGRAFVHNNITLGGSWNWNVFYETREDADLVSGTTTIHGNQYRYVNTMPFFVNSHYYMGEDGGFRPFLGIGAGALWKEEKLNIGTLSQTDNAWQFGLAPELGAFIPFASGFTAYVSAKYTYGLKTTELTPTSYLNFSIGIGWENF